MIHRQVHQRSQLPHPFRFGQPLDEKAPRFFVLRSTDPLARVGIARNLELLLSEVLTRLVALAPMENCPWDLARRNQRPLRGSCRRVQD